METPGGDDRQTQSVVYAQYLHIQDPSMAGKHRAGAVDSDVVTTVLFM